MKPTNIERLRQALADGTITGDGHTIFAPSHYAPHFSEDELRKVNLIRTLQSDYSDPKSTIYDNDGNPVKELEGVYNLNFLYWLAGSLGVEHDALTYNGRGSQATALVRAIVSFVEVAREEDGGQS